MNKRKLHLTDNIFKNTESYLGFKYPKIIADSRYESEENEQQSFIKLANYEISKTRKYKNDIGRMDNIDYN